MMPPEPAPLPRVPMTPTEWQADCPACGNPFFLHDCMARETTAGTWVATDADRYPCCDACGTQFEIAEMVCVPSPLPPAT